MGCGILLYKGDAQAGETGGTRQSTRNFNSNRRRRLLRHLNLRIDVETRRIDHRVDPQNRTTARSCATQTSGCCTPTIGRQPHRRQTTQTPTPDSTEPNSDEPALYRASPGHPHITSDTTPKPHDGTQLCNTNQADLTAEPTTDRYQRTPSETPTHTERRPNTHDPSNTDDQPISRVSPGFNEPESHDGAQLCTNHRSYTRLNPNFRLTPPISPPHSAPNPGRGTALPTTAC